MFKCEISVNHMRCRWNIICVWIKDYGIKMFYTILNFIFYIQWNDLLQWFKSVAHEWLQLVSCGSGNICLPLHCIVLATLFLPVQSDVCLISYKALSKEKVNRYHSCFYTFSVSTLLNLCFRIHVGRQRRNFIKRVLVI